MFPAEIKAIIFVQFHCIALAFMARGGLMSHVNYDKWKGIEHAR